MWFWRQKEPSPTLRRLHDRMDELEHQVKTLDLEWSDTYDKLRHIIGKIAKRSARMEEQTAAEGLEAAAAPAVVPGPQMSPDRAYALEQIRKRRGG